MPPPKPEVEPKSDDVAYPYEQPGDDPEYDAWFREQVQIGIDEADRGELIPQRIKDEK